MVLWWIGNAILLLVVVPVLVALLNRVLAALERIRGAADDILAGGVALIGELDDVPEVLAVDRPAPSTTSPSARSATPAPSPSCWAERGGHAMPAVAWVTVVIAALIIAAAALGLVRVIFHLRAVRQTLGNAHRRGAGRRQPDQHRAEVLPSVNANLKPVRDFCERSEERPICAAAASTSTTSWAIGYTIAIVVVLVVVALVVPILLLARAIGKRAEAINDSLQQAVAQHRRAQGAEHDDRARRGHRRRAPPRPHPAGRLTE